MPEKFEFRVAGPETETRLDVFVGRRVPDLSRSRGKRLIAASLVTVDGAPRPPDYPVKENELIAVEVPDPAPEYPQPEKIDLDVIFEDSEIAVVNKPAGLAVHPARAGQGGTLVNALVQRYPDLPCGGGEDRPGVVHRLDRDTSGVMIVAKTEASRRILSDQFRGRRVAKEYRVLAAGHPGLPEGEISLPLGPHPRRHNRRVVRNEGGKPALTRYRVLEEFREASYLSVRIETGRTHQIRVHLAHLGCPVLGDDEYGRSAGRLARSAGVSRQMLHALRLEIDHPLSSRRMSFEVPIPSDMAGVLEYFRGREAAD
ncbi:MAG TPA: RluA family pseudouridine synthase [bacterium]|nr:RluA family pseudouridine synthase [bacterium]HPQ65139.1 RluA family pseudouridine synthase [bacterium]